MGIALSQGVLERELTRRRNMRRNFKRMVEEQLARLVGAFAFDMNESDELRTALAEVLERAEERDRQEGSDDAEPF